MPPKFKRTVSKEDLVIAASEETEKLLDQHSGSDDNDFFYKGLPGRPKPNAVHLEDDQIKQFHGQIAGVTETMRSNVGKILERGERLDDLYDASARLGDASLDFQAASTRMRKRAWIQNVKTRAILGMTAILILVCFIVPIIIHFS